MPIYTASIEIRPHQESTGTIIEIRPFRNGWQCFETPGVEPVFAEQRQAIDYAQSRASFRSGEIRVFDSSGNVERILPFTESNRQL
jgi:methyl coenzyme M reductase alpha subunit